MFAIRGFAHVHSQLIELVKIRFDYPDKYDFDNRLTASGLVEMAVGLGVIGDDFAHLFRRVATIRNKYAHYVKYEVTQDHYNTLKSALATVCDDWQFQPDFGKTPVALWKTAYTTALVMLDSYFGFSIAGEKGRRDRSQLAEQAAAAAHRHYED